ncbi:MAG: Mini-ribonuclease 3 [Clostridia bacterium]|nr:Mini-ribonuclease 3 [Clostridia bacterium]
MEFPYLDTNNAGQFSPLALAYIGDAVYEVYVRSHVLEAGNTAVNKLHKASTGYVSAKAQSSIIHAIEMHLTEEETAVYKRGRNAHSNTSAKNADIVDYRHATGFEAVIGYLFIMKRYQRLNEIIKLSFDFIDNK